MVQIDIRKYFENFPQTKKKLSSNFARGSIQTVRRYLPPLLPDWIVPLRVTQFYVCVYPGGGERASLIKRLRDETGSDVLPSPRCSFAARICLRHSCWPPLASVKLSDFWGAPIVFEIN